MPAAAPRTQKALLQQQLAQIQSTLDVIGKFAEEIIAINSEAVLFERVAKGVVGRLGFEDCVIYEVTDDRRQIIQVAAHGAKSMVKGYVEGPLVIDVGEGVTGLVALTGEYKLINDTRDEAGYIADIGSGRAELAVPVILDEEVIGVIDSEASTVGFFNDSHLQVFQLVASMLAVRIKAIRLAAANAVLLREANARVRALTAQVDASVGAGDETWSVVEPLFSETQVWGRFREFLAAKTDAVWAGEKSIDETVTRLNSDASALLRIGAVEEPNITLVEMKDEIALFGAAFEFMVGTNSEAPRLETGARIETDRHILRRVVMALLDCMEAGGGEKACLRVTRGAGNSVLLQFEGVSMKNTEDTNDVRPRSNGLQRVEEMAHRIRCQIGGGRVGSSSTEKYWMLIPASYS